MVDKLPFTPRSLSFKGFHFIPTPIPASTPPPLMPFGITDTRGLSQYFTPFSPDSLNGLANFMATPFEPGLSSPNLDTVHGGGGLFEWNHLPDWLHHQSAEPSATPSRNELPPDGKIDPFKQGPEGACWFLSALDAINNDPDGKERLSKMIAPNGDGTYTVTFGNGVIVTVTQDDLAAHPHASGDADTIILEEAARKVPMKSSIDKGGWPSEAYALLTGIDQKDIKQSPLSKMTKDDLRALVEQDKDGITMVFDAPLGDGHHAWSVRNIDFNSNTVYYVNPWDTSKVETMTIDELLKKDNLFYMEVSPTNSPPPPAPVPTPRLVGIYGSDSRRAEKAIEIPLKD